MPKIANPTFSLCFATFLMKTLIFPCVLAILIEKILFKNSIPQWEGHFVKNQKKMSNFQKSKNMKKWKIDFLEICNSSKKLKKGNERKITKNEKMGGARFARAPPFFHCSFIFLFSFFGKVEIFQKIMDYVQIIYKLFSN